MPRVIADSHYAAWLADRVELESLEASLTRLRFGLGALARRGGWLGGFVRGLSMAYRGRNAAALLVCDHQPGAATVLFCEAWLRRRRRVVLIELLRGPRPRRAWARALYGAWSALVRGPALRRAVAVAHVLTREEVGRYSELYGLEASRIEFVPWPWRQFREPQALEPRASMPAGEATVLSAGRAYCDWPTLLAAARGREWQLTVLCSTSDAPEVIRLSAGEDVVVHAELPLEAHAQLLERAGVYVISMREDWVSAGQVRLMHAVQAGVPVVATDGPQLRDYCIDGETALLVACGDHRAMAQAVERVLADPELAEALRQGAWRHSAQWVRDDYLEAIGDLVTRAANGPSSKFSSVIHHVSLDVSDLERSGRFYDSVLGSLGWRRQTDDTLAISWGIVRPIFFAAKRSGVKASAGHVCFSASGISAVKGAWEGGMAAGGTDDGAPGPRPEYGGSYYSAYLLDPDGHRIEIAVAS